MFDEYQKISKKTMEQVIKSEFSGDIKNGFVTIGKLCSILNVPHQNDHELLRIKQVQTINCQILLSSLLNLSTL